MLNILVVHGYKLHDALDGVAVLHYVDGPLLVGSASRPWWLMDQALEFDSSHGNSQWDDVVEWWLKELSEHDGIIGLSQGSVMMALLLLMVNHPECVPGFSPSKKQDFKFGIFCSGFVSHTSPHADLIYGILNLPTLHTVDSQDTIVRAARTIELQDKCHQSILYRHDEGHVIPVGGHFPRLFQDFILDATK
ncbi:serine hydrolase-domain-containing protein [Mycena albidolilacea]|uniref:Serine hydrolase-domain-containing protein n=1 Tax=Mycena albidolilacea TaxID=1033008 RepID=A0AAD6ZRN8_9AGAR|nr:serine hydrolase-domain-containing protein [Mycena albidolilacea]